MEYSVKDLVKILLKKWYIILLSVCVVGVAAFFLSQASYAQAVKDYDSYTSAMEQMKQLIQTDECYSRYIVSCLDDKTAADCGHCSNCTRKELFPSEISASTIHVAEAYINKMILPIEPRKQWAYSSVTQQKRIAHVNQPGFCISIMPP